MNVLGLAFFCSVFCLFSCSSIHDADLVPFGVYLGKTSPKLAADIGRSCDKGRAKMEGAFAHVDQAAVMMEKEGMGDVGRSRLYSNICEVAETLYAEYAQKRKTEPLTSLEASLYERVNKNLLESGEYTEGNREKVLVLETRKQAERDFDQLFSHRYPHSQAGNELKKFVDSYTEGFFILNQPHSEDFRQFHLDDIAQFKTCFYLLMAEAIK